MAHAFDEATRSLFDEVWAIMEQMGRCDGIGGAEYRRVKAFWRMAGMPGPVAAFIGQHANELPDDNGPFMRIENGWRIL